MFLLPFISFSPAASRGELRVVAGEIDDGVWDVYFGPLRLGRLHDRYMRIEYAYGRLHRHSPRRTTEL